MGLSNEDVQKIIAYVTKHGLSTQYAADKYEVSRRRIQQLVKEYKNTGEMPTLKKRGRKPRTIDSEDTTELVKRYWKKYRMGAVAIAEMLRARKGIKIDNNLVHKILLENNMARENDNKKGRKKRRNKIGG